MYFYVLFYNKKIIKWEQTCHGCDQLVRKKMVREVVSPQSVPKRHKLSFCPATCGQVVTELYHEFGSRQSLEFLVEMDVRGLRSCFQFLEQFCSLGISRSSGQPIASKTWNYTFNTMLFEGCE